MQGFFARSVWVLAFILVAACTGSGDAGVEGTGGTSGTGGSGGIDDLTWPPDAKAYFDQYGILHADCMSDEDCAMVLGYYHAFDRFVQMDFRRRFPTGRLAEVLNKDIAQFLDVPGLAADTRALFSTLDGTPMEDVFLEHASDKTLALLEAYSAGVNQWIVDVRNGEHGATFPREFAQAPFEYGPEDIPDWTPSDSVATLLALLEGLTNDEALEVRAGEARELIGNDVKFSDLWSRRPGIESSIVPPGWKPPSTGAKSDRSEAKAASVSRKPLKAWRAIRRLSARLEKNAGFLRMLFLGGQFSASAGSNSWVLAASRTATGNPLLANDPHLSLTQPSVWYLAHLDAKTNGLGQIHSAGATTAGIPTVLVGQSDTIAWGMTNTHIDYSDVYVEELVKDAEGNPSGVMFKGAEVPFSRIPFTIRFNDGSEEQRELLMVPHHGPVREIDAESGVALTLRWTAQNGSTDMNMFTALNLARTVEEARLGLENSTTSGQCVVVADASGNIGYFPYSRPPKRTWATNLDGDAPPWLPLDGRGDYEWTEHWDYADLPQLVNPKAGFIATANNDITGALFDGDPTNDGYPPLQTDPVPGFRHGRIVSLIEALGDEHTTDTMRRIQSDVYSLLGELVTPKFLEIAKSPMTTLSENAQKVVGVLERWNYTCPTGLDGPFQNSPLTSNIGELREASGCAAFHAVLYDCGGPILRNENARINFSNVYFWTMVDPSQLKAGDVYWDDPATPEEETKYDGIEECFETAATELIEVVGLGTDETKWAWGRMQGLTLRSDLAAFGLDDFNNPAPGGVPFANDGGYLTVDPTDPSFAWVQSSGASMRFVCEVLPEAPKCTVQLPGGQSAHIDSPHYDDLFFKYLEDESVDFIFDIDEAKEAAVRTVTFE